MTNEETRRRETSSDQIIETVASWPAIAVEHGRFNSVSFDLEGSEIGHLHPQLADIDYPTPLRERLLAEGLTEAHHAVPMHPTATTLRIESVDDADRAIRLFRLSYLVHAAVLRRNGAADPEIADIDIEAELDALEPSDAIRSAFETAIDQGGEIRG